MSTIGKLCIALIFVLCGMSPWLSFSALSQEGTTGKFGAATHAFPAPYTFINESDILNVEQVSENELLSQFIIGNGDERPLISLYAYSFDVVCGDSSNENQKEADWLQKFWAENVNKVGIVAVIPKQADDAAPGEMDNPAPLNFGSYYSEPNGKITPYTQDNYCDILMRIVEHEDENAWFKEGGLVAIQYPYVDREYEEIFFLRPQYGEYRG